jgi:hypothetical protein
MLLSVINCQYKYNDNTQKHILSSLNLTMKSLLYVFMLSTFVWWSVWTYPVRYLWYIVLMLGQFIYYHLYLIIKYKTPTEYGVHGHFAIFYMSLCKSREHIQTFQTNPLSCRNFKVVWSMQKLITKGQIRSTDHVIHIRSTII